MKIKNISVIMPALFVLLFVNCLFGAASATNAKAPRIAVLDFKNLSTVKGYDFLAKSISESMITSLQKSGKVTIVERQQLAAVLEEKKLALTGLLDDDISAGTKIGALTKADNLIIGSFTAINDKIEVNARLVDADSGKILLAEKITEKMGDDLFAKIDELADSVVISLLNYESGSLNLDSSPQGAEVKIDNSVIGNTPITEKKMKAGRYTATLSKPGFETKTVQFEISADQRQTINTYLEQKVERLFPYHISLFGHPLQILPGDYQPDFGISFDYLWGDVSVGLEYGGNIHVHAYTDETAPGTAFKDNMVIYYHRFDIYAKYNFFKDNKIVSPYLGLGLGLITAYAKEYDFSHTAFYYKPMLGFTFFPVNRFSVFVEFIYHDLGDFSIKEKRFNLFGDYDLVTKSISMKNIMVGFGLRIGF